MARNLFIGLGEHARLTQKPRGQCPAVMAGGVGGLLGLYCYYLGWRRRLEDKVFQSVPSSLLRCPFVMGLLSKGKSGGGVEQDKATLPRSLSS